MTVRVYRLTPDEYAARQHVRRAREVANKPVRGGRPCQRCGRRKWPHKCGPALRVELAVRRPSDDFRGGMKWWERILARVLVFVLVPSLEKKIDERMRCPHCNHLLMRKV